jgi:hypothetical protein
VRSSVAGGAKIIVLSAEDFGTIFTSIVLLSPLCVNCVQSAACTMCFFYNKKTFKIIGECILMFAVNKKERKKERKFSYTVKN